MLPTVYNVQLPDLYYKWTGFLNIFDIDWSNFFIPGACLEGGYTSRLLLRSVGPLVLIVVVFLFSFAVNIGQALIETESLGRSFAQLGAKGKMWTKALVKSLPSVLFLSFCLCAPTASAIFKTWDCVEYVEDSYVEDSIVPNTNPENPGSFTSAVTRFLRGDLRTTCDTFDGSETTTPTEYAHIVNIAWVFAIIYSILLPCIFIGVLLPSRKTLRQRRSTQLVRATGFLHREYEPEYFCAAPRLEHGLGCTDPRPSTSTDVITRSLPPPRAPQGGSQCSSSSASSSWGGCN